MFSDYRAFGECKKLVVTGPLTGIGAETDTNLKHSFLHVIALGTTDVVLNNVVLNFDAGTDVGTYGDDSDETITIPPGGQLAGVRSCDIASGQAQFLYFI